MWHLILAVENLRVKVPQQLTGVEWFNPFPITSQPISTRWEVTLTARAGA